MDPAWNCFEFVWFSFLIILLFRNLAGLRLRHDDAVGGFFDAPQAGADNTSFEGRKQRWRDRVRALDFPHAHERSNSAAPARANPHFAARNPKSADALFISSG